jgi:para-aminobenzoate synthetase
VTSHRDPVAAFTELAGRHERMFWLDGGGSRPWSGRRSVLGFLSDDDVSLTYDASAREVTRHRHGRGEVVGDDVFAVLGDEVARDAGDGSVTGVDAVADVESPGSVSPSGTPDDYSAAFEEVQRQLYAGNSYEVNLPYREAVDSPVPPVEAYLRLRALSPAPYAGYLQHGGVSLLSSSPERYATVDRHGWLETRPIKGTTPRGATAAEDRALAHRLATDPKYRAENLMIVDLLRNDLSTVCEPGTVTVPELMRVESYPSVHQLVSTVRGRLRDGVGTVEALRALFPAGSMTGAPKLRTMQIIERVEDGPRGVYAGAFGWFAGDGRADLGVVIRSLVARRRGASYAYVLGTGGGITVRSNVAEEYAETRWKAERLRRAVESD